MQEPCTVKSRLHLEAHFYREAYFIQQSIHSYYFINIRSVQVLSLLTFADLFLNLYVGYVLLVLLTCKIRYFVCWQHYLYHHKSLYKAEVSTTIQSLYLLTVQ